jgi:TRAP-type mannitol/chloroaromatic compound transport system permease small subunit
MNAVKQVQGAEAVQPQPDAPQSFPRVRQAIAVIETVSEWSGRLFSGSILVLLVLSCYEVFTRRVLHHPTIWTHEILSYFFCASVLLLMGYTQLHKGHANVDLVSEHFSPRTRAMVEAVTFVLFMGFFIAVFFIDAVNFAATSWAMHERTPTAFNPIVYPAKTILPVGAALLFLQGFADFLKNVVFLAKGERL